MKFLDPNHPFFARPVVRWLISLVPLGWAVAEFVVYNSPIWGMIFAGLGAYAFYFLIVKGPDQT